MKTPCKHPGCAALLDKSGFCERHASHAMQPRRDYEAKRKTDPVLQASQRFRSSTAWRKLSKLKLSMNPLCEDPFGDHARRATTRSALQVHHIKPLATHPECGLDLDNLQSVCTACHAKLEVAAKRGDL